MPIDRDAALGFMYANARLLDRHRLAVLQRRASAGVVVEAVRPYRNADGGFGHALEPDVRAPESEPSSTLQALEILAEVGRLDDPMVADAAAWVSTIAHDDGSVPFVLPTAAAYPHAPWMVPSSGGSHLTFGMVAALCRSGVGGAWLERATQWCWERLEQPDQLSAYWVKFALDFLDRVPDEARARTVI
ncbi:MAG TPA: hypothetical protein VEA99_21470, partial [Gemmatimonadaceae bacterium]|nr:hypothetical protein [Gemmatimonadaceae bacterium]